MILYHTMSQFRGIAISEQDLTYIKKISLSDEGAFNLLFKKYYTPLYQFTGRFVRDVYAAENIVQEVFVKLWTNREELTITTNVKAYLYTAVKNHSLNYLKQDKRNITIDEVFSFGDLTDGTPEDDVIKDELTKAVHNAIDELPAQCRKIYVMKKYDDLSYQEIADLLGISINTVKTQMKRAMKSLTSKLEYLKILLLIYLGGL